MTALAASFTRYRSNWTTKAETCAAWLRDLCRGSRIQASRPASRNGVGEDRLEIQCLNDAGRGKARQITAVKVASAMAAMSG